MDIPQRGSLEAVGARGLLQLTSAQALSIIANVAGPVVLARLLSTQDFGLMAMAATVSNLVLVFRDAGLSVPVALRQETDGPRVAALHRVQVRIGAVLALAVAALAPAVGAAYGHAGLAAPLALLAAVFLFAGIGSVPDAVLRRDYRFGTVAVLRGASAMMGLVAALMTACLGGGVWSLVVLQLVEHGVAGLASRGLVRLRADRCSPAGLGPSYGTAARSAAAQAANHVTRNADNALIGACWGQHVLGLYDQAYRVLTLPVRVLGSPLLGVMVPLLSELRERPDACRAAYVRVAEKAHLVSAPLACLMVTMPEEVLRVLFGDPWAGAAPIVAWLGLGMASQTLNFTASCFLVSQYRVDILWRHSLFGAVVSLLSFSFAVGYGAAAVAAAYSLSGLLVRTPLLLWHAGRAGPARAIDHLRALVPSLAATPALVGLFLGLKALPMLSSRPWVLVSSALLLAIPATAIALALFPSGRALMSDGLHLVARAMSRSDAPAKPDAAP